MISRIDGPSSVRSSTPLRRTGKPSRAEGPSFSDHLESLEDASALQGTAAAQAVGGMLNLQEVDDALAHAARGKMRAEDLLDTLDGLRLDLLSGTLGAASLERLTQTLARRRYEVQDPKLKEILDEIDLRAQVELAKFTR
ncbi:MAG: flagellar assembly protein FliX [Alphaproteobacteria bacterium]|nr:flagellar assembly protein FliX [Alphaproteobacteria bacterium]